MASPHPRPPVSPSRAGGISLIGRTANETAALAHPHRGGAGSATPRSDGVRGPLDGPGGAVPALGHGRCPVTADRHAGRGRRTRHAGGEGGGRPAPPPPPARR